jgi:hypothetical protein
MDLIKLILHGTVIESVGLGKELDREIRRKLSDFE